MPLDECILPTLVILPLTLAVPSKDCPQMVRAVWSLVADATFEASMSDRCLPSNRSAFKFLHVVLDVTSIGAVPLATVEINLPAYLISPSLVIVNLSLLSVPVFKYMLLPYIYVLPLFFAYTSTN